MNEHNEQPQSEIIDENHIIAERRKKLHELRKQGIAYPNDVHREHFAHDLYEQYNHYSHDDLEQNPIHVTIAGRMMLKRVMGKASFAQIQDMTGTIQIYVRSNELGEAIYETFKTWDLGDIIFAEGTLFKTKTDELSVKVTAIRLLTKSIRPLPDKFHGLNDQELKYRRRYVDLIVNEKTRHTFQVRAKAVQAMRDFLNRERFLEVETPMMHALAGGALAKPFVTFHNTLDMELYLRVAPELYLKRLVVGGLERVYEINRCFRNEGISTRHNPEFTTLEFYYAYANYLDAMDTTEKLLRHAVFQAIGSEQITYQGTQIDFGKPFERLTLCESILQAYPELKADDLNNIDTMRAFATKQNLKIEASDGLGKIWLEIFEKKIEAELWQPTFITAYPTEVSPLARQNDHNPFIVDRFELFIAGRELANAFSELNDPEEQERRFEQQMLSKAQGDEEAMPHDEDYVVALEYGLPPVAGVGIGIDRLAMLLADTTTIRDVLLFPLLRHEK